MGPDTQYELNQVVIQVIAALAVYSSDTQFWFIRRTEFTGQRTIFQSAPSKHPALGIGKAEAECFTLTREL